MADDSDAIADWPLLNALVNTAAGATWVSIHHGGGVGIGRSIHAGMVCVADGTELAAQKLERVLTSDPGTGVMRHADAGYERAIEVAARARRPASRCARTGPGVSCASGASWRGSPGTTRPSPACCSRLDGTASPPSLAGVASPPAGAERLRGLVIPGLANAHSHAFQRALRGRTQRCAGLVLDLARADVRARGALDPDSDARAGARHVRRDGAGRRDRWSASSTTSTTAPAGVRYADPNAMGAAVRRGGRAGRRADHAARRLLSARRPGARARSACSGASAIRDAEAWAARVDALRARAGRADRRRDPQRAGRRSRLGGDRRGVGTARSAPLHAHVSEQPAENEACLAAYGDDADGAARGAPARCRRASPPCTPPTSPSATSALLGGAGACCCLCPTTERDLADGIGPARALRDAGAPLALGSDSQRGDRAVRGGARGRARRAAGHRRARPARRR